MIYCEDWPKPAEFQDALLVYDQKLSQLSGNIKEWINHFPNRYGIQAGEELKQLKHFPEHIENLLALIDQSSSPKPMVIALGGGSVGDFAGFSASILKRGLPFVQIPSTFLAAIDSAHGGKTALNSRDAKNQVGSFYPAEKVYIIKPLLMGLKLDQISDGFGELFKMGLIRGGDLWDRLNEMDQIHLESLWPLLPEAIEAKYTIVEQDPYEKTGVRQVLNLGHTFGHIVESYLGVSHGRAVGHGIVFSIGLSKQMGLLPPKTFNEIQTSSAMGHLWKAIGQVEKIPTLSAESLLKKDKKRSGGENTNFVFVKGPGDCVVESIENRRLLRAMGELGFLE